MDALKDISIIHEASTLRKLAKYHFHFPWPGSDRHCMIEFTGHRLIQKQGIMISMISPSKNTYFNTPVPEPAHNETRMRMNLGCLYAEKITNNQCKIIFCVSADINIVILIQRFLPKFLINYGTKTIMYYLMEKLRNKIYSIPGSIYEERIFSKFEFYEKIRKMIFSE